MNVILSSGFTLVNISSAKGSPEYKCPLVLDIDLSRQLSPAAHAAFFDQPVVCITSNTIADVVSHILESTISLSINFSEFENYFDHCLTCSACVLDFLKQKCSGQEDLRCIRLAAHTPETRTLLRMLFLGPVSPTILYSCLFSISCSIFRAASKLESAEYSIWWKTASVILEYATMSTMSTCSSPTHSDIVLILLQENENEL